MHTCCGLYDLITYDRNSLNRWRSLHYRCMSTFNACMGTGLRLPARKSQKSQKHTFTPTVEPKSRDQLLKSPNFVVLVSVAVLVSSMPVWPTTATTVTSSAPSTRPRTGDQTWLQARGKRGLSVTEQRSYQHNKDSSTEQHEPFTQKALFFTT